MSDSSSTTAEQFRDLEPLLHRAPAGGSRADYEALVTEEFWEVGASGAVYTREHVLDALSSQPVDAGEVEWTVEDFAARELADGLWLVTYDLTLDRDRRSRRSTVWRRTDSGWRAEYHQGTLV